MRAFETHTGLVVGLNRPNVDTDAIIPKQFLKSIKRIGFGPYLFDEWRYQDYGEYGDDCSQRPIHPEFVLNQPRYKGASILLTRDNFGCGSSREHAVWALEDYGFRCLIGTSYADIFFSNCGKNGILAITQPPEVIEQLFQLTEQNPGFQLTVDLPQQQISDQHGHTWPFSIDAGLKQRLLAGLDDIGVTLQDAELIRDYEAKISVQTPWVLFEHGKL